MTRLYLKIFFTFWLITALIIVATNLVFHWMDLGPDHKPPIDRGEEPAKRLLFQMVGSAINRNTREVIQEMRDMPGWSIRYFYVVDKNNHDLLDRPLPPGVTVLLPKLTSRHPFDSVQDRNRKLFGRYITLNDGTSVKLITISTGHNDESEKDVIWQLFINNIWPLLLVSILISGSACFFLARHFTRSLNTLQQATRQIATGDLSVRVSPKFSGRRDEIASLGKDFDHMTERLQKAMLEQKRLIKDVSHELRSPLARLQVALGLAQQRSNGSVDKELDRIKQAADYLNNVITDILALPMHDNVEWELDDTLDLRALLETLVENYQSEAARKGIILLLQVPFEEALVPTHGNMLVGVFENILRNAMHYTPNPGKVTVEVELAEDPHRYLVRICDSGPGVPTEHLDDIFQPFYRTDEARARESGGYGLGLAIAQRSVALHKGEIKAYNQTSGGLCVTVALPHTPIEDNL
jgi:two-component system sensor histidine kinase CpxA